MSTITEMAAKHNLCNNDQTTMAYRLGAIEVLEEIEKAYNQGGLIRVLDLIEQLKK